MSAPIAVIPGDGVGQEVVPEGVRVLSAVDPGIETVCREGRRLTADLGGRAATREVGDAVLAALA